MEVNIYEENIMMLMILFAEMTLIYHTDGNINHCLLFLNLR